MGFLDRLLNSGSSNADRSRDGSGPKQAKPKPEAYYLDSDSSSSLGNRDYMREAKTIRRTFPGTLDNPGGKELVTEVDALDLKVDKRSEGLGDPKAEKPTESLIKDGIPKPVKKTFAETMTQSELDQKLKGSALKASGVNTPTAPDAAPVARKEDLKPEAESAAPAARGGAAPSDKPGSIDPFRAMVRDLNK